MNYVEAVELTILHRIGMAWVVIWRRNLATKELSRIEHNVSQRPTSVDRLMDAIKEMGGTFEGYRDGWEWTR